MGHSSGLGTSQKEMEKPRKRLGTCSCQSRGLAENTDISSGFWIYRCDFGRKTGNSFVGAEVQVTGEKRTRLLDGINNTCEFSSKPVLPLAF